MNICLELLSSCRHRKHLVESYAYCDEVTQSEQSQNHGLKRIQSQKKKQKKNNNQMKHTNRAEC